MKIIIKLSTVTILILGLISCAGETLIKKRNLDVQTKMSSTIFLEPVSPDKRTVYIRVRNTSDKELHIDSRIKSILTGNGYTIVQDPDKANFMLQANVLKVGRTDADEPGLALAAGFGGAVIGSILAGDSRVAKRNTAIAAGLIGFVFESLVNDIYYNMVTDIQVRERPLAGENIRQRQDTNISQGDNTKSTQTITGTKTNWKTYRSRIVSVANQTNLKFSEAQKALEKGLISSIGGIF